MMRHLRTLDVPDMRPTNTPWPGAGGAGGNLPLPPKTVSLAGRSGGCVSGSWRVAVGLPFAVVAPSTAAARFCGTRSSKARRESGASPGCGLWTPRPTSREDDGWRWWTRDGVLARGVRQGQARRCVWPAGKVVGLSPSW